MSIGAFRLNTLAANISEIVATGGTIAYLYANGKSYKSHTFTTTGANNFVVTSAVGFPTVDVLLVGGGGGSGGNSQANNWGGGGGGGGQVRAITNIAVTPQTYTLTVGAGGTAGASTGTVGGTGGSTIGFGNTAIGGGGGASNLTAAPAAGAAGGGGGTNQNGTSRAAGSGNYSGGTATFVSNGSAALGGGGGSNLSAGGSANFSTITSGNGADGPTYNYNGNTQAFGSGGRGGNANGTAGVDGAGTYGKGASGRGGAAATVGNAGNAGIAIVRYPMVTPFTLSYITYSTSTTANITIPATAQVGDVAILFDMAYNNSSTAPTSVSLTGSGWTALDPQKNQITSPANNGAVWYKTLVSGDPGAVVTGMSGTLLMNKMIVVYRPSLAPNTITPGTGNLEATATYPTSVTLTLPTLSNYFVAFGLYSSSGTVTTRGSTVTATRELNVGTTMYVKLFEALDGATTFADPTISMGDYGTNIMGRDWISFK